MYRIPQDGGTVELVDTDQYRIGSMTVFSGFAYTEAWGDGEAARLRRVDPEGVFGRCYPYTSPAIGGRLADVFWEPMQAYVIDTAASRIVRLGAGCNPSPTIFAAPAGQAMPVGSVLLAAERLGFKARALKASKHSLGAAPAPFLVVGRVPGEAWLASRRVRDHLILLAPGSGLTSACHVDAVADLAERIVLAKPLVEPAPHGWRDTVLRRTVPVMVAPFELDRRLVTNAQFLEFVRAHPEWRRSRVSRLYADASYLRHWQGDLELGAQAPPQSPVVHVSWFAARAYAAAHGGRLPTVAEWELVAAADETRRDATRDPAFLAKLREWYSRPAPSVLPGFGLTFGFTTFFLSAVILLPLAALVIRALGIPPPELLAILLDARAVASYRLSFGAAALAACVNAVFGFVVAWSLVRYDFPGRRLLDMMIDLPFALPTAVSGIALATVFSPAGWLGQKLALAGVQVAYTWVGVVVALVLIGLPFVVRSVQPALIEVRKELEDAAEPLGAGGFHVFRRIILPTVAPALATGFTLAFARGIGEYGSVVFISGNLPLKTEITPLLIVIKLEQYDYAGAAALGFFMLAMSFVMLLAINLVQQWGQRRIGIGAAR